MNTLFKHLKKEHCDALFSKGEILIGNYKMYQNIEEKAIVDPTEGYKYSTILLDKNKQKKTVQNLDTGEFLSEDHEDYNLISFGATTLSRKFTYPDSYIYCTSLSSQIGLFEGYDSCFEIIDLKFFSYITSALFKKGLIKLSVEGYFISYFSDKMVDHKNKIPAYWVKDKSFEKEMEHRFVFGTLCTDIDDRLEPVKLFIPQITSCCKRLR